MIIGLCAKKQNGKDTMADYLCQKYKFIKLTFASPLKDACKLLFGFTAEQVNGDKKEVIDERWGVTPRTVLQFVGTDLFRKQMKTIIPEIDDNFWVICLKNSIDQILKKYPNAKIVISDVRFPNEIKMIQKMNGQTVKIIRESVNNTIDQHSSEKIIDDIKCDFIIENNETKEKFYEKINKFMSQFKL